VEDLGATRGGHVPGAQNVLQPERDSSDRREIHVGREALVDGACLVTGEVLCNEKEGLQSILHGLYPSKARLRCFQGFRLAGPEHPHELVPGEVAEFRHSVAHSISTMRGTLN
jgi:hypothetical protein